ncbi:MAG: hypothetical protein ACO3JG_08715 [Luteolibacter sp.]
MKLKPTKTITALALSAFTLAGSHAATLIAGFDFQTTTTGGTAATASSSGNPSPLVYNANFGSATLYLNGTNGSSTFTTGVNNPQVTSFSGTDVNTAGTSFSTVTSGTASLAVANSSANGFRMVFVLSMTDLEGLGISYATQATNTGFGLQTWSYSTNGSTFTDFDTFAPGGGSGGTVNFATNGVVSLDTTALSVLDGEQNVYIGLTLSGATNTSGNNRLDNIQFTAVPEPSAALLGGLGMLALLRRRRLG